MGIDYYNCKKCDDIFADCGEYIMCEKCGTSWCSDECADEDGHKISNCKKGIEIEYNYPVDDDDCNLTNSKGTCDDCEHYEDESCGYCRNEIISPKKLLETDIKNAIKVTESKMKSLKDKSGPKYAYAKGELKSLNFALSKIKKYLLEE